MHLIDDVDFISRCCRAILRGLNQVAHVINASIRRRIHLDDVHVTAFDDGTAMLAFFGQINGWLIDAFFFIIQRSR